MSSKNRAKRGHRDRDRELVQWVWDDSRQQEYYANEQERCWVFRDGTSIPYEEEVTQAPDIRVPRSAVHTSHYSDREGNDLNSQFSKLGVSQEDHGNDKTGYPQSYNDSPTDEHHETHYTSLTQRPDSVYEEKNGSAAQGPPPQPQSGSIWSSQQTTYEAQNSATEQRFSTSIPIPPYGAQQYPLTYDGRSQYPSDAQQSWPSTYTSTPTYGAQQPSVSYESQYDKAQQPHSKTHNTPYSVMYPDDNPPHDITDPRLYRAGIIAFARVSLGRTQKKQKIGRVELKTCARLGTVFKSPWPESSCMNSDHDEVEYERKGAFRWFVVVLEPSRGTKFYSCVPITTYQGQGFEKAGIILSAHAQIGDRQDLSQVSGMGETIRFKPKVNGSSMPRNSLVNFEKVYSIDGDVPAIEFGKVDRDQRHSLLRKLEESWSTVQTNLTEEERNRRQVEDRNRWERNQDDFADD